MAKTIGGRRTLIARSGQGIVVESLREGIAVLSKQVVSAER